MKRLIFLFMLCLSTSLYAQNDSIITFDQINAAVKAQQFKVTFNMVSPVNNYYIQPTTPYIAENIRISPDSSFIIIADSLAVGYLPYYGNGYAFAQYGIRGIVFKNTMINPQYYLNNRGRKPSVTFIFDVVGLIDIYKITVNVDADRTTYMQVQSTKRSPITYTGKFYLLPPIQQSTSNK
ncbi:MAG: DUF4251 domain-containing protein [Marinifilaceae bacterium]